MANPIEQAARAIRTRLTELLGEQQQLQKALGALEGLLGSERGRAADAHAERSARRRPARRTATSARGRSRKPGRRRGPSRADQFLELVAESPGITVAQAAERLDASRQTLYNVSARLQREGRLRKDGSGFYPAERTAPQAAREGSVGHSS
jgi:hypothetical protein